MQCISKIWEAATARATRESTLSHPCRLQLSDGGRSARVFSALTPSLGREPNCTPNPARNVGLSAPERSQHVKTCQVPLPCAAATPVCILCVALSANALGGFALAPLLSCTAQQLRRDDGAEDECSYFAPRGWSGELGARARRLQGARQSLGSTGRCAGSLAASRAARCAAARRDARPRRRGRKSRRSRRDCLRRQGLRLRRRQRALR